MHVRVHTSGRLGFSYTRVGRGIYEGFLALGHYVELLRDAADPFGCEPADLCLFADSPRAFGARVDPAAARRTFYLLSPNSSWVPDWAFDPQARPFCPSGWAIEQVLNANSGSNPALYLHGVGAEFLPEPKYEKREKIRFLHKTSSVLSRKGTAELVAAWVEVLERRPVRWGQAELELVIDATNAATMVAWQSRYPSEVLSRHHIRFTASSTPDEAMPAWYRGFDVVVQPSRAEAFGMVPLEAACAGLPCIATPHGGHREFFGTIEQGWVAVPTIEAESDDAPSDVPAPILPRATVKGLVSALQWMLDNFEDFRDAARWNRSRLAEQWQWKNTTARFLKEIGE